MVAPSISKGKPFFGFAGGLQIVSSIEILNIRQATEQERLELLEGSEGFVAYNGDEPVACAAYRIEGDVFYGHSLMNVSEDKIVVSRLIQALRRRARSLGYDRIVFGVSPEMPALLRLAATGKARITQILLEMDA